MVSFVFLVASIFLMFFAFSNLFDLKLFEARDEALSYLLDEEQKRKFDIKTLVKIKKGKKRENVFIRELKKTKALLEITGQLRFLPIIFGIACVFSFIAVVFCLAINNLFLIAPLPLGVFLIPFWYMQGKINEHKKQFNQSLETAVSIITTSYLRCENIEEAVLENMPNIDSGIKPYFKELLVDIASNPDRELCLKILKSKINNSIFQEWVDALISCETNVKLKVVLEAIVSKFSDLRLVNNELEVDFLMPKKNFMFMVFLVVVAFPILIFLIDPNVIVAMMGNVACKILIVIVTGLVFFSVDRVINIIKPLEK